MKSSLISKSVEIEEQRLGGGGILCSKVRGDCPLSLKYLYFDPTRFLSASSHPWLIREVSARILSLSLSHFRTQVRAVPLQLPLDLQDHEPANRLSEAQLQEDHQPRAVRTPATARFVKSGSATAFGKSDTIELSNRSPIAVC